MKFRDLGPVRDLELDSGDPAVPPRGGSGRNSLLGEFWWYVDEAMVWLAL